MSQVLHKLILVRFSFFPQIPTVHVHGKGVGLIDIIDIVMVKDVVKGFVSSVGQGLVILSNPLELFIGLFHRKRLEEGTVVNCEKVVRTERFLVP